MASSFVAWNISLMLFAKSEGFLVHENWELRRLLTSEGIRVQILYRWDWNHCDIERERDREQKPALKWGTISISGLLVNTLHYTCVIERDERKF